MKTVVLVQTCDHDNRDLHNGYGDKTLVHALGLLEVLVARNVPILLHLRVGLERFSYPMSGFVSPLEILLLEQVLRHLHVGVIDVEDGFRAVRSADIIKGPTGVELNAKFVDNIFIMLSVLGVRSCYFLYWP